MAELGRIRDARDFLVSLKRTIVVLVFSVVQIGRLAIAEFANHAASLA